MEKKEVEKMFKDFENKLLRKMDKKMAANIDVLKQEMEAIADRVKIDSKQRFEIVERQLRIYVDDAIGSIRKEINSSTKKAV